MLNDKNSVTVFAPATCSNLAVGFDILGFPFHEAGDTITLTRRDDSQLVIEHINHADLPTDINRNTASAVLQHCLADLNISTGFSITIEKGIPLGSGMGGSAASAVAALVALNAFLSEPLSLEQLAHYALYGEEVATGQRHGDNVIPCLYGGLTLIRSLEPVDVIALPVPDWTWVLIHPELRVDTKGAREILPTSWPLSDIVKQSANLAGFISALYESQIATQPRDDHLRHCLNDVLIEPHRSSFVSEFEAVKTAAHETGALGVSLSGSGPTMFAVACNKEDGQRIAKAMSDIFAESGIGSEYWVTKISKVGARVLN